MTRLLLYLLLAGVSLPVIATAEDSKEKAIQKDRERLQGKWQIVDLGVNGNEAKEEDAQKLVVINETDGSWRLLSEGKEISKGTSTIDPKKKPKTIDFKVTEGEGETNEYVGIYSLGRGTRKLAFAPVDKGRPTEFSSTPGSGHVLVKFELIDDDEQQGSAASADGNVFTNSDLLRINKLFTDTYEFTDNDFIYEEKLSEAVERVSNIVEGPAKLTEVVVEVKHVGKELVNVTFFPEEELDKTFPQVRFVEDRNADIQFYSRSTDIGLGGTIISGEQSGHLKVGFVVAVSLAKTLRRGDRLKITGTLIDVKPVELAALSDRKVAGFVIVASGVERASRDDSEDKAADAE